MSSALASKKAASAALTTDPTAHPSPHPVACCSSMHAPLAIPDHSFFGHLTIPSATTPYSVAGSIVVFLQW